MLQTQQVHFLVYLSTKCSGRASVTFDGQLCVVRKKNSISLSELLWSFNVRRPSVRPSFRQQFLTTTSPLKPHIGFWPNFTGMLPGWSPIKVVQTGPVGCVSKVMGSINRFSNCNFQKSSCPKLKAQSFHIWFIASSIGSLPKLFNLCSWGQNWPRPGKSHFYIELYKEKFKRLLFLNP